MKTAVRFATPLLLAALGLAPAQTQRNSAGSPPPPDLANMSYGPHERHVLDLWKAPSSQPTPLVVFIHGGGFRQGSKDDVSPALVRSLLDKSISVMAINYRLAPEFVFPAHFLDAARAIQFARSKAREWNIDPARVGATGASAGAGTSLWIGFHDDLADPGNADPVLRQSTRLTCIAVNDAQTSYDPRVIAKWINEETARGPGAMRFYGLKADELDTPKAHRLYEAGSPINHLTSDDPPVFAFYGGDRGPLPPDAPYGAAIHHINFGLRLKERMDPLGIECIVHHRDDSPDRDQEFAAFFARHLLPSTPAEPTLHSFDKQHLERHYWSEGAAFGDLDRDGQLDVVYGPYWWKGPDFSERSEIYAPDQTFTVTQPDGTEKVLPGYEGGLGVKNAYSRDNFFAFVHDVNGDGWNDVLTYTFPGEAAYLYLNPRGQARHWERHTVLDQVGNESPAFTDLTGDGKPEIVCVNDGNFGYASADWSDPTATWQFTPITRDGEWGRFTHGLGVADMNGDGRLDVLFKDGWFEQPASLEGKPLWKQHPAAFARDGAQMYAYDVNGDGLMDVVTALAAHGFGLAWHEQLKERDENGSPRFKAHIFMNEQPHENRYGVVFSELHAMELVDIDGDGLKDIITGKCFWSHGPEGSPDGDQPAVLYWFKLVRGEDGSVDWVPHRIDDDSGVGRQISIADFNGDGRPDIVIGNKKGAFVFRHQTKKVSEREWQEAQPKPVPPGDRITVHDRTLSPARPAVAGMNPGRVQTLIEDIRRQTEESELLPFAGYLIARHGKIVAHEAAGWSNYNQRVPLRTDSLVPLASVTKAFTATAFMILWDEGRVALDDPVRKTLPPFGRMRLVDGTEAKAPLRMLHLLTHSAGFSGHFPLDVMSQEAWEARSDWTLASFVDRIAETPLQFSPGTGEHYSSLNSDILARIIEVVSGQDFPAFLRERILEPLGMHDTSHFPPPDQHHRIARMHRKEAGQWNAADDPLEFDHTFPHGGYGLYSTTGDLAIFVQMILNGGVYGGRQILSPRAVDRMLQMLSPVPHRTAQGELRIRGASWEVGDTIRGVKDTELDATVASRPRQPDEPQRFFGRTGLGGMFIFGDRDADVLGVFATKAAGRQGISEKQFLIRVVNAVETLLAYQPVHVAGGSPAD